MRIDSHQHFWKYDPIRDAWIDDSMGVLKKDFFPRDLAPVLNKNLFGGCIAVQADQSEKETEFLLSLADKNNFVLGVVGWVDLLDEKVEERLEYFSAFPKFKGVRHIVQAEPVEFQLRKDFQNGISKLSKFDLTYDILVYPSQLRNAIQVVKKFPDQKFVIDHLAKPYIKDRKLFPWAEDLREIAKYENVSCKISGFLTEASWEHWGTQDFDPYFEVLFEAFSTKRVMYGSDWPVCLCAGQYEEALHVVENFIKQYSKIERNAIMGENALNFYNLKIE